MQRQKRTGLLLTLPTEELLMSVIVHIGYHKTGTTWFQKHFYPGVESHRYIERRLVRRAFVEDNAFKFKARAALDRLGASEGESLVLCEEGLSGYLHNGGLMGHFSLAMAHRIHSVFPHAQIVVFVRSQPEIIASSYQQYVRGGGTHSPQRYLFPHLYLHGAANETYRIPRFSFDHFEYLPLIDSYVQLFGLSNVHIFSYEKMRSEPKEFFAQFKARLGLEVEGEVLSQKTVNSSLAMPLVRLARVLNLFTYRTVADKRHLVHIPYWYTARRALLETLNGSGVFGQPPSPSRLLGASIVEWIRERFWETNAALADRYGLPLAELGYPISKPRSPAPAPTRLSAIAWTKE